MPIYLEIYFAQIAILLPTHAAICSVFGAANQKMAMPEHAVYIMTFDPAHRWFYFPKMLTSETLLIKGFDSMLDGRARFTAAAAFIDPATPPGAPPRESIEARALIFFD
jgi:hypothetical protein